MFRWRTRTVTNQVPRNIEETPVGDVYQSLKDSPDAYIDKELRCVRDELTAAKVRITVLEKERNDAQTARDIAHDELEKLHDNVDSLSIERSRLLDQTNALKTQLATANVGRPIVAGTPNKPYHFLYTYDGEAYAVGPFEDMKECRAYGRAFAKFTDDDHYYCGVIQIVDAPSLNVEKPDAE